jgi:hypothetical protein
LANLFQGSRSTFSCVSFPNVFAFQGGMWDTQISALLSSPTVSGRFLAASSRGSDCALRCLIRGSGREGGVPGDASCAPGCARPQQRRHSYASRRLRTRQCGRDATPLRPSRASLPPLRLKLPIPGEATGGAELRQLGQLGVTQRDDVRTARVRPGCRAAAGQALGGREPGREGRLGVGRDEMGRRLPQRRDPGFQCGGVWGRVAKIVLGSVQVLCMRASHHPRVCRSSRPK